MAHTPRFRANLASTGQPAPTGAASARLTRRKLLKGDLVAGAMALAAPFAAHQ